MINRFDIYKEIDGLSDEEIIGKISDFLDENDNLVKLIIKEHI
jgi:hypothetical protein